MKHNLLTLALGVLVWHGAQPAQAIIPATMLAPLAMQQEDNAPRLVKARLTNVAFGNYPSLEAKIGEEVKTFLVSTGTVFNINNQGKNLTGVAQTCLNQEVYLLTRRNDSGVVVDKLWDYTNWLAYTTRHKGAQIGAVKYFNARSIGIADLTYLINDETKFVKGTATVGRKKLEGITTLYVSGDVKDGMPVALIVADSPGGVNAQTATNGSGNTRPPSNSRPASTGSGSIAQGSGSGVSPTEKAKNGRPASTGSGGKSPTERTNGRPPSTGTGNKNGTGTTGTSPTEKAKAGRPKSTGTTTYSPTEKAAILQKGIGISITFTILDSSDMITNASTPGGVLNEVAEKVGVDDKVVEVFGLFRFNGEKMWEIERRNAKKMAANDGMQMFNGSVNHFTFNTATLKLKGFLKDDDNLSNADMLADIDTTIDLLGQMNKGWFEIAVPGKKVKLKYTVFGGRS
ncbi:MAG: hypothetical protein JNJ45_09575 [Chthonomonas sp.]|nr:hypothetical protein [Chthonomonas sp.]